MSCEWITEDDVAPMRKIALDGRLFYDMGDGSLVKVVDIQSRAVYEGDDDPEPCAILDGKRGFCSLIGNEFDPYVIAETKPYREG